jgi:hypothetical protein
LSLLPIFSAIDPNKKVERISTAGSGPVTPKAQSNVVSPSQTVAEPLISRPQVKKVIGRGAFSTPSILDALKEDDPQTQTSGVVREGSQNQYVKKEVDKSFTQLELLDAWRDFVTTIDDAPQMKSALSAREPFLSGHWQIEYELDTELQLNRLTLDLKPKLTGFLRRHFQNEALDILFKVTEETNSHPDIPYTDEERWNLLVSRYPSLGGLKSKFGLDFEHY